MQRVTQRTLRRFFAAALFFLLAAPLFAQNPNWEIYGGIQYARFHPMAFDEPIEPFVNGPAWNLAVSHRVSNWLGIKADVSRTALYDAEGDPPDHTRVSLLTYAFGPVFCLRRFGSRSAGFEQRGSKILFGEVLFGGYRQATKYTQLAGRPITGVALMIGGGMDVPLGRRIAIRAFDCDWLAFLTDNAVYLHPVPGPKGNLRLSTGLIFRF